MEKNIKKESWCDRNVPPMLQTWEEALSDLDESEKEFERGDVRESTNKRESAESYVFFR